MQETEETWVLSLGREDPPEEGMATHSSILAWRIPWTHEPDGGSQRVRHNWSDWAHVHSPSLRIPFTHLSEFPLIHLLSEFPLTQLFSGIPHILSHSDFSLTVLLSEFPHSEFPLSFLLWEFPLTRPHSEFPHLNFLIPSFSHNSLSLLLPEFPHILPSLEFPHSLALLPEFLLRIHSLWLSCSQNSLSLSFSQIFLWLQNSLTQTFSHLPSLRIPSHPPLLRIPLLRNPSLSSQNSFSPCFSQDSLSPSLSQNCLIPSISQNSLTASLFQNSLSHVNMCTCVCAHTHTSACRLWWRLFRV